MPRRLLILAAAFIVGPVLAQSPLEPSVAPLASARFDRLVRLLVDPTDGELRALGALHEAYMDRYRAEIESDAARTTAQLARSEASDAEFPQLLQELDRLESRVSEVDADLFRRALEVVSEPRQAGIARVAAARERLRGVRGVRAEASILLGNGTVFVDLVDLLAREADALDPAARSAAMAFAASESDRLTTEARVLTAAMRDALARWLPVFHALERDDDATGPEMERRMRRSIIEANEAGRALRAALRGHHAANRAAVPRVAEMLGDARGARFREKVVLLSLGEPAFEFLGSSRAAVLDAVLSRARSGSDLAPEMSGIVGSAELRWRVGRTESLEQYLAALDQTDAASWSSSPDPGMGAAESAAQAAMLQAIGALLRQDQDFADVLAAALGENAAMYLERTGGEDGAEPTRWMPKRLESFATVQVQESIAPRPRFAPGACDPIPLAEIVQVLGLAGMRAEPSLVGTVHAAWLDGVWNARVEPLARAFRRSTGRSIDMEDDERRLDPDEVAAVREAGLRLVAEIGAANRELCSLLEGAIGVPPDSSTCLLLSLGWLGRVPAPDAIVGSRGGDAVVPDPVRVFATAGATVDEVQAMLSDDPEAWSVLASEALRAHEAVVLLLERTIRIEVEAVSRKESSARERARQRDAIVTDHLALIESVRERIWQRLAGSAARVLPASERRSAFLRALQRETYPSVFAAAECADPQLERACALPGLDDELRARLEALRAEYLAVFDDRSSRMIALRSGGSDPQDEGRRLEEIQRLGGERRELAARTLAELRRLIGDDRARGIPGILRSDAPSTGIGGWKAIAADD